ncbi:MAG: DUF3853 family protein [Prevotellaceae bacterium]|jgi:hypothetical protein|nr:DUF3853 family protein [Prevotellaceae bacterium]
MTREFDMSTPVFQLTAGDLIALIEERCKAQLPVVADHTDKRFVHGLNGLMGLFGCSKTTANRIKQSGKIDEAITQIGNIIVVDAEKALALAGSVTESTKKHANR